MNKIQLYFNYFVEHYQPKSWEWYTTSKEKLEWISKIKAQVSSIQNFESLDEPLKIQELENAFREGSNCKIKNTQDFLNEFVFQQDNGMGNVSQGVVWETKDNPHQTQIKDNANPSLIFAILSKSKEETIIHVNELLQCNRELSAVKFRLLRTLYPDDFTSPDAPNKLERLIKAIKDKLNLDLNGSSYEEKHKNICNFIQTDDPVLRHIFTWELFYILESEINLKKALVYYGAPGTGKTFQSFITAKQFQDAHRIKIGKDVGGTYTTELVQFHPSYTYEDFIEGIRPTETGTLKLFNGSFKAFCKKYGKKEFELYHSTDFLDNKKFQEVDYDFSRILVKDLTKGQREKVGIYEKDVALGLTLQDVIEPAFFIIDEINRAELSKVFGELMYSLEYRGYKGKIKSQYAHLCKNEEDESCFYWENDQNWFFIPQNIYLIATMNNVDRSVDAFDFALRRRFMWKEIHPNYQVIRTELVKVGWTDSEANSISHALNSLNSLIENDNVLDKNYRIGHSYILELTKLDKDRFDSISKASEFLWNNFIQPLLEEYLKGLGNEQKANEKIKRFKSSFVKA